MKREIAKEVDLVKKKQWCSNCSGEANLYCCWNTTYCDTNCQSRYINLKLKQNNRV